MHRTDFVPGGYDVQEVLVGSRHAADPIAVQPGPARLETNRPRRTNPIEKEGGHIMPEEIVLVARGVYAEYTILAAAEDEATAQRRADRWNLDNLDLIRNAGDEAHVGDRVPYFAAGG